MNARREVRWLVLYGPLRGQSGMEIYRLGENLLLRTRLQEFIKPDRRDCRNHFEIGDAVICHGLEGKVIANKDHQIQVEHDDHVVSFAPTRDVQWK